MPSGLVLVRTVAGLEGLAAEELAVAGHRVVEVGRRQVVIEPASGVVSSPRLADDWFVVYAAVADPGRTKAALTGVVHALRRALGSAPGDRRTFAVTASFVGVRNYNRFDIEDLVGTRIAGLTGGQYHSRRYGVVPPAERAEWRVVLDGKTLWVGLRPYAVPLHRRAWRTRTVRGSLHPPVAAAMARLAGISAGDRVLDPFCGAGTVLLEAHAVEPQAEYVGIDRDPGALAAAQANAANANAREAGAGQAGAAEAAGARVGAAPAGVGGVVWCLADAGRLDGSADRIVTNPPWDVRLSIGELGPYARQWRRALRPGGRVVAILSETQGAQLTRGWRVQARYDLAVAGQHPRIVVAEPSRS
ncbi:methyltransferase domain-containing protein [Kribbella sp. NBC_00709]|uniref:methyltransferase domain-containing protein n=1 Tax=Kribbella sp. NBC_00709 TaxID=2975972 RepID=UPI002E2E5BA7|nr:methyltransferase domain-containing protein [Kribbella sp. NBC_00709]